MLIIKCAGCKRKLWKYNKIGHGKVLRCHKERITRPYLDLSTATDATNSKIYCQCGKEIGIDKGNYIKMIEKAFTYSGTKSPK